MADTPCGDTDRVAFLLTSGLPGAGKSTYCEWLAQQHGYYHWETDVGWSEWSQLIGDAAAARHAAAARGEKVVVEWGFEPMYLPRVRLMRRWLRVVVVRRRHGSGMTELAAALWSPG